MKAIKRMILSALVIAGFAAMPLAIGISTEVRAATAQQQLCEGAGSRWTGSSCIDPANPGNTLESNFRDIVNILLFVIGAVAVVMIIIGGIKYVISGGDQSAVTSAKNTIMYSVVGLLVAIMAYAIVNFVASSLS